MINDVSRFRHVRFNLVNRAPGPMFVDGSLAVGADFSTVRSGHKFSPCYPHPVDSPQFTQLKHEPFRFVREPQWRHRGASLDSTGSSITGLVAVGARLGANACVEA